MIDVTRLDGGVLVVNEELVLTIEQTPDTMICFTNGEKLLVQETPEELVIRTLHFKRRVATTPAGREDDRA